MKNVSHEILIQHTSLMGSHMWSCTRPAVCVHARIVFLCIAAMSECNETLNGLHAKLKSVREELEANYGH